MLAQDRLPLEMRAAYLALHRQSDSLFSPQGVTADQFVLLATLARGNALTQRQLAKRMPSDPSTVRAMLVLLEKRGLVCRESHPTDARAKTVALTRAGQKMFHKLWLDGQSIRNRMVNSLSVQEAETLVNLLRRVSDSLSESSPAQVATSPTRER